MLQTVRCAYEARKRSGSGMGYSLMERPVRLDSNCPVEARYRIENLTGRDALTIDCCRSHDERGGPGTGWRIQRNRDRKSTRLNSSHGYISYAVFCLKKKNSTEVQVIGTVIKQFFCPTRRAPMAINAGAWSGPGGTYPHAPPDYAGCAGDGDAVALAY